jgi:phosphatidylserine decarboxylase
MEDTVKAGERFGMIKFGSRVDVFVPATASVRAKVGDETVAGETVLAELH